MSFLLLAFTESAEQNQEKEAAIVQRIFDETPTLFRRTSSTRSQLRARRAAEAEIDDIDR